MHASRLFDGVPECESAPVKTTNPRGARSGECSAELELPRPIVRYAEKFGVEPQEYAQAVLEDAARRIGKEGPDGLN